MKYNQRKIPVEATFDRVWEQMELLLSKTTLKKFINLNIKNNFFGLNLELILPQRSKYNIVLGTPEKFLTLSETDKAAEQSVISIKQAYEYFKASDNVGPMTKPVLLYYGMVSFAKALINSTYTVNYCDKNNRKKNLGHGLSVSEDEFKIMIHRTGEYQTFRDCYIGDTRIYAREYPLQIHLKDLMAVVPGMRIEWNLAYDKKFNSVYDDLSQERAHDKYFEVPSYAPLRTVLKTSDDSFNIIYGQGDQGEVHVPKYDADLGIHGYYKNLNVSKFIYTTEFAHIIDIYYLIMFILCFYARYRPFKWSQFLKTENNLFLIKAFLRRASLDFPMLIYSELTGIKTYFETFG
jgi:hypothetical protein